jgi:thioesterase domain-containing protein
MKDSAFSSSVEMLTPIWQRLLQRSSIGAREDFFELGGDPGVAIELFDEIVRVCGRKLSPLMIYQAPTITALASMLEQEAPPRLPPLIPMKSGTAWPPIFIAHGMGGSVMEFFHLVKYIQLPYPIYGLQAKGSEGIDTPLETIEDMAQFHLDAVKELQPHGPYVFLGHSLGGLVALEMARRVLAAGEAVALLAMLDSYPHILRLPLGQRARVFARRAKNSAASRLNKFLRMGGKEVPNRRQAGLPLSPATQRVRAGAQLALSSYKPRFYRGDIKFVRAAIGSVFPDDPAAVWGHLASRFQVETVPGDHNGMLRTHFESLAAVLSGYLREALCQQ